MNTFELRGHGDAVPIVVNGQPFRLGDAFDGRFGIDARLDERLVRHLALLALRRRSGATDGWTTAAELAFLADRGGSATAAAKFLWRALCAYPQHRAEPQQALTDWPGGHLIQFESRFVDDKKRVRAGVSRGPYRLGVAAQALSFDDSAAWSWIVPPISSSVALDTSAAPTDFMEHAHALFRGGDIIGARRAAATGVRAAAASLRFSPHDRDGRFVLASLLGLVANLDMELGQPRSSLAAAELAGRWFEELRHPLGIAHAHQVRAHALGQLEDLVAAAAAARNAMVVLDRARAARAGAARAGYSGVLGQRLSKLGYRRAAGARLLTSARRTCEEAGLVAWAGIWSVRLCENAMGAGDLGMAEGYLTCGHELLGASPQTVPQEAALKRVTAEFLVAAGRREEARPWAVEAHRIGLEKGMANQIRLMLPIVSALELERE